MKLNVQFLPKDVDDPLFEQRESGRAHTPYEAELYFYGNIKNGDAEAVKNVIGEFFKDTLVVGRMSDDNLRQSKYFAVSCITLATRYAIEGGLPQSEAYNLSDEYIRFIDGQTRQEDIVDFLVEKAVELAKRVGDCKLRKQYPLHIRQAMKIIDAKLHEKLTVMQVAGECGVSADYLSSQFKKHLGVGLARYIILQKLEASKQMLTEKGRFSCGEVAYILGFCSETHFITSFKKTYGVTPKQYAVQNTL